MTEKQIIRALQTRIKHLTIERDRLRDLEYEISDLLERTDEAVDNIQCAIDRLSETF